jgi:hypothetical protein
MVETLRAAVGAIGEELLGRKMIEVGTHSVQSGAAMATYLGKWPVYRIMPVNRTNSTLKSTYVRGNKIRCNHYVIM